MTAPINLEEIEEELKQISHWPWDYRPKEYVPFVGEMFFEVIGTLPDEDGDFEAITSNRVKLENADFISKSPERIAALVKRCRNLESMLSALLNPNMKTFKIDGLKE
ncbi:MAG: hypothetical protein AB7O96_00955 [Pseudobdellovibrionaceae bacterium]